MFMKNFFYLDCPTATLVDLSLNSDEASPTTPARVTPHRKCKKLGTTAKGCEEIHKVIDDKDDTGKYNILVSLENIVPLSTINCSYNGKTICMAVQFLQRKT